MSERQKNDHYPTQPELALAVTKRLAELIPRPRAVVEPSAGTGAFIRAAKQTWPGVPTTGIEIDPDLEVPLLQAGADLVYIKDWLELARSGNDLEVLLLGNPPFKLAREHITAGMRVLARGHFQAMLLRMSFMGSLERVPFWQEFPARYLVPLVPRPSFIKGSSDNSEYGMFVWQKGYQGSTELLSTLVWR